MKTLVMSITLLALLVGLITTAAAQPFESPILISPVATPDSRHQAVDPTDVDRRPTTTIAAVRLSVDQLTQLFDWLSLIYWQSFRP